MVRTLPLRCRDCDVRSGDPRSVHGKAANGGAAAGSRHARLRHCQRRQRTLPAYADLAGAGAKTCSGCRTAGMAVRSNGKVAADRRPVHRRLSARATT
eukprot:6135130-Prymnesium_polylepis.1